MTAVSDYGRIITGRHQPDLWYQHYPLHKTIFDLRVYLRKYLPGEVSKTLHTPDSLIVFFNNCLNRELARGYVKLIGIPLDLYPGSVSETQLNRVFQCFEAVIRAGNSEPFKLHEMPATMGAYNLNSLIRKASAYNTRDEMDHAIADELTDGILRQRFCETLWTVREYFLENIPERHRGFMRVYVLFNALRLSSPFTSLYRPDLNRAIDDLIRNSGSIERFIAAIVGEAKTFIGNSCVRKIDLDAIVDGMDGHNIGLFRESFDYCRVDKLISNLRSSVIDPNLREAARLYANQSFERV